MAAMSLNDDADASWCSPADTTSHSKIAAIYLGKFEREIERFTAARDDVEARIDHAFNIVVTAWHLCDWVFCGFKNLQIFRPNAIGCGHHASLAFQLTTL